MIQDSGDEKLQEIAERLSHERDLSTAEFETLYGQLNADQKEDIINYMDDGMHLRAANGNHEDADAYLFEFIVRSVVRSINSLIYPAHMTMKNATLMTGVLIAAWIQQSKLLKIEYD